MIEIMHTEEKEENKIKYFNINVSEMDINRKPDIVRLCAWNNNKYLEYELKRPKGHWIVDKERLGYFISECSNCNWIGHGNETLIYRPKFCPNCGADMRGDNK